MFTGIIQNLGEVKKKIDKTHGVRLFIRFVRNERRIVKLGESIAVEGVCLTVSARGRRGFWVDIVDATLQATTLGRLKIGSRVNLERSLKWGDEIGGHFVSGHVDTRAQIIRVRHLQDSREIELRIPKKWMRHIVQKGSVGVDGISLTVQKVTRAGCQIALIPHTLKVTTLDAKGVGDWVNIEIDLYARYVEKIAGSGGRRKRSRVRLLQVGDLTAQGF